MSKWISLLYKLDLSVTWSSQSFSTVDKTKKDHLTQEDTDSFFFYKITQFITIFFKQISQNNIQELNISK